MGAGIVLELGVQARARYRPEGPRRISVTSDLSSPLPISTEVVRRLLGSRTGSLTVHLRHELPEGQGFGTSAAGALSSAIAVAEVLELPTARAIATAHLADLFGGGGLGGVAAILGGGTELRRRPGIPPWGRIVHRPFSRAILVGVVGGPIPSPGVLRDARSLRRIVAAGAVWEGLGPGSSPEEFFAAGERFTDRVGLAPPALRALLRALRHRGTYAFQAMFGETFVALPRSADARTAALDWLARGGVRTVELGAARDGARTLSPPLR